ncbi:imidazolonepropionase [Legionella taurinensis]|uniref:Imidazolonepropionase n=1 Tax=Legionella taurinensis TaxID=70611 RepID=A0AB38N7G9_9GAMM|nr:imidazolonepropionase [Legionella taurinensis]MDX1836531.1 imidazolonepropionase [Legionella taurinensis]PUT43004.1 imidazolonepropionase [Legionella taurinensis]PUT45178.1 imidazolonepropionase [Legionella taurinensis]PUT45560.1 imidazolonepropionase [Legionella taurinensis]PUT49327.1 imidazolonepropionase [Legionella taurinensis]
MTCDTLLMNATTVNPAGEEQAAQAIAIAEGRILWCGAADTLPAHYLKARQVEDCQGQLITPGLIDCHTHLVYAGNRADEFKKRLQGATYADIAAAGGGIVSTVRQTRAVSEMELLEQSLPRLQAMQQQGVTTVEIKSGYGLDLDNELKMLRVARRLGQLTGVRVKTTFLGAHAVPVEYKGNAQGYVDYLLNRVLPAAVESGLVDAVDVFCETIGFTLQQTEQIFLKAQQVGLPIKCHAEQLSRLGASQLAASMSALSCDHLEYLDNNGAAALARQGTVAVLLPGAYYFLGEKKAPPVDLLRQAGVGMAVATDCNPGSSPTTSLLLMLSMACRFFSLTVQEALAGVTHQAAKALGLADKIGSIQSGLQADLVQWSVKDSAVLCYHFGSPVPQRTMIAGTWLTHSTTTQELQA